LTVTVTCLVKNVGLALTFRVGEALPLPEPGETSAHPTSVVAVHAQLEDKPIANWNRPPPPDIDVGRPETLAVQPDGVGVGDGDGEGEGDGDGDGPVTVPEGWLSLLLPPEHAGATSAIVTSSASGVQNSRVIPRPFCMPSAKPKRLMPHQVRTPLARPQVPRPQSTSARSMHAASSLGGSQRAYTFDTARTIFSRGNHSSVAAR
jgi:hypothetical protein